MNASLVWFRRDLRLHDHAALYHALAAGGPVHAAFVFDTDILDQLVDRADRRVAFIHDRVAWLKAELERRGGGLHVLHGSARECIPALATQLNVTDVHAARDYEPFARQRDAGVAEALAGQGRCLHLYKDQVIFDTDEVLNGAGRPYHVFTPYKRAWLAKLNPFYLAAYPIEKYLDRLAPPLPSPASGGGAGEEGMLTLEQLGFHPVALLPTTPETLWQDFQTRIDRYRDARDFPSVKGPSYLSVHLRFGTVSVRDLARYAYEHGGEGAQTWLSELVWREFYQMLIWHYPATVKHAFQAKFDAIVWPNPPGHFEAWAEARTGYPIVDAAMRQLNQTGYMHNRLRMIAGAFLVKDLHVDWRLGEQYFAAKLIDYDQAANIGGWQWSASVGTDAQPWFRIFNPITQSEKFDPHGKFIRRYLPELANVPDRWLHAPWKMPADVSASCGVVVGRDYPPPIVDHAVARAVTLSLFKDHS